MRRNEDGTFVIDRTPEIRVFWNENDNITLSIDDEFIEIDPRFAKEIGGALIDLAEEDAE